MISGVARTVVLASGNAGKLRELSDMLSGVGLDLKPQSDWNVPEAVEDGLSFVENALLKARHAAGLTGHPSIADDSGLVVPALNGAPGIYSARYAGPGANDHDNNRKLLEAMEGLSGHERRAYFHCAMVHIESAEDPVPLIASASWWGEIARAPSGQGGFGYDPLFWLADKSCSSAQLPREVKNAISHRGQATRMLLGLLELAGGCGD